MNMQDEFFQPEEIDEQIERLRHQPLEENADAQLITYLRNSYAMDAAQERESLNRMWSRVTNAAPGIERQQARKGTDISMQDRQTLRSNAPEHKRNSPRMQRWGILAAVLILAILVGSMALVFNMLRHTPNSPSNVGGGGTSPTPVVSPAQPTKNVVAFQVKSVDMAVSPASIAGMTCGANLTVKYTATFHIVPGSAGGTMKFSYTVNNGRSQNLASLSFAPGETTKTYSFTWSGNLPADHTYPGPGGVEVTSPNHLISALVAPTGSCVQQAAFKVLSVDMAVNPTSVAGLRCGTYQVVTYTATFHVAPNSPGGTVQFSYTINNGRGSNAASLSFAPGETTKTYSFTWSGNLPADHTYPGNGGVITTSPNAVNSPLVGPTGQCS